MVPDSGWNLIFIWIIRLMKRSETWPLATVIWTGLIRLIWGEINAVEIWQIGNDSMGISTIWGIGTRLYQNRFQIWNRTRYRIWNRTSIESETGPGIKSEQDQVSNLKQDQVSNMKQDQVSNMKQDQVSNLKQDQVSNMKQDQVSNMKQDQVSNMKQDQVSNMKQDQVSNMKQDQVSNMKQDQVSNMKQDQVSKLKQDQVSNLIPGPVSVSIPGPVSDSIPGPVSDISDLMAANHPEMVGASWNWHLSPPPGWRLELPGIHKWNGIHKCLSYPGAYKKLICQKCKIHNSYPCCHRRWLTDQIPPGISSSAVGPNHIPCSQHLWLPGSFLGSLGTFIVKQNEFLKNYWKE